MSLPWWGSSGLPWWGSSGLLWWGSSGLLWWGSSGLLWWGSSGLLWWGSSGLLWWGSSGLLLWGSPGVLWLASRTSAGGAPSVPPAETSSSSLEAPQTSEVPQGSSHNSGIRFEPQSPACSLARSESLYNLNYFSLSDIQNFPDSNENFEIVVHKTMDAEEVESIVVGQMRARSPSLPHSNSHSLGRNAKSKTGKANEGPSNKKPVIESKAKSSDKSKSSVKAISGKVSLSKSQIPKLDSKKHPSKSK